jgi:HSP20 family protein
LKYLQSLNRTWFQLLKTWQPIRLNQPANRYQKHSVKKSDLRIEAKGNTIRIAGSKAVDYKGKASVHRLERRGGNFDRAISLPIDINGDGIKAECRDGILALFVPRAEHDKPRAIAIT